MDAAGVPCKESRGMMMVVGMSQMILQTLIQIVVLNPESKFVLEADQILSWEDRQITMEVKYCSSYIWDKDKLKKLKAGVPKDPWNSDK
jgi:hypothetical protein